MLFFSLGFILVVGGILGYLAKKISLPSLIIYLLIGIFLGYFKLLDSSIVDISSEIRKVCLIIILLKAGLSLDLSDLKKAGRPAILLSFLPAVVEMITIGLVAPLILHISYLDSFLLGSVLGAVSPAVVVPRMIRMMEKNQGTKKKIPQMIIAGASLDDVVMIVFYTSFLTLEKGNRLNVLTFFQVPISILVGVGVGILAGIVLAFLFKKWHVRDSIKLSIILGICFLFVFLEQVISKWVGFSSLLAVITIGITLLSKRPIQASRIALKCDRLWSVAEIFLFVLVGASLDFSKVLIILVPAIILILIGLIFRIFTTIACVSKTNLNMKERLFVGISYLPKATVQASIGGGLMELGYELNNQVIITSGYVVLATSVLAILITAPLGAVLMDRTVKHLITKDISETITS